MIAKSTTAMSANAASCPQPESERWETGIGVLLVEHHTEFVFGHCDRVTTFNLGRLLRHGTPQEVRNDPEVIRVYLGA